MDPISIDSYQAVDTILGGTMLDFQNEYERVTGDTMQAKYAAITGSLSSAEPAVLGDRYRLAEQALAGTDLLHQLDPYGLKSTLGRIDGLPWQTESERSMRRMMEANRTAFEAHEASASARLLYEEGERYRREAAERERWAEEERLRALYSQSEPPVIPAWMFERAGIRALEPVVQDDVPEAPIEAPARTLGSVLDSMRSPERKK